MGHILTAISEFLDVITGIVLIILLFPGWIIARLWGKQTLWVAGAFLLFSYLLPISASRIENIVHAGAWGLSLGCLLGYLPKWWQEVNSSDNSV